MRERNRPFRKDEQRVADYLAQAMPGIQVFNDPIGLLISNHEFAVRRYVEGEDSIATPPKK